MDVMHLCLNLVIYPIKIYWVLPLLSERVPTSQDKELVGGSQIDALLDDPQLPFGQDQLIIQCVRMGPVQFAHLYSARWDKSCLKIAS
jgi:hypothetical protein